MCPFARGIVLLTLSTAVTVGSVQAQESVSSPKRGGELVKQKACLGCHTVDKKRVGPGFKQIADRYGKADVATIEYLATSIRQGGAGKWGVVPMPAQSAVSKDEATDIAAWILNLKE